MIKHKVHEHRLKNGAKGLVIDVPNSEVVNLGVSVKGGFLFSPPDKLELPHILEHVMFAGAGRYPTSLEFKTAVEKNGARLGASTFKTDIYYNYDCAGYEADRILELLIMQLVDPKMPEKSFKSEVSNVKEELQRNITNHQNVCSVNLYSRLMPKSFWPEQERLDQMPDISRDDAMDFYRRTHSDNNLRFFMAGHFPDGGAKLIKQLETGLAQLPQGEDYDYPTEPVVKLDEPVIEQRDLGQLYYNITFCCDSQELQFRDRVALVLVTELLTGGWQSWVFGEARERGLAYGLSSYFRHQPNIANFSFYGNISPENIQPAFKLMAEKTQKLLIGDFKDSDLTWVKDIRQGSFILGLQTPGSLLSNYYPTYVLEDTVRGPQAFLDELMSINKEDILRALEKIIQPRRWGLSLVGNISKKQSDNLYQIVSGIWSQS